MLELGEIEELDRASTLAAAAATRHDLLSAEVRELMLAAHWAHLYNEDSGELSAAGVLPGTERAVQVGHDGTPLVLEFAAAELAAVLGRSTGSGAALVADALDLEYRHPLLWAAVRAGLVRVWQARAVIGLTAAADLSLEQARWVDAATIDFYATLSWRRFLDLVNAKIIEVDPAGAEARRKAAEAARYVRTGQSNAFGVKTLIARAAAGDVIYFVAMADQIATILAATGDTDSVEVRRSKAIGILGNPAYAVQLIADYHNGLIGTSNDNADPNADDTATSEPGQVQTDGASTDADEPTPPGPAQCPTCAGTGTMSGNPEAFVKPSIDPAALRPRTVLYVHISRESLAHPRTGAARVEGLGPITAAQVADFLGHSHVTVKPVLDPSQLAPVDGYETPDPMAEALHLRSPADMFPYGTNTTRNQDKDHTRAYTPPARGGPPGQTRLGNLGLLTRFHHRIRTHGRWRVKQPEPGVYLWRSPHSWIWLVDPTGTHLLGSSETARTFWENASPCASTRSTIPTSARGPTQSRDDTHACSDTEGLDLIPSYDALEYEHARTA